MKVLSIYLGSQCNLNCEYCHRQVSKNEPKLTKEFLQHIKETDYTHIKFFGGEPLLYFKEIYKIVKIKPNATFYLITNGILLKDYLVFLREYRFLVCISYDGQNKGKRGYDPFTGLIDYPWLSVSCLLYHGNTNFKNIIDNFKEKEKIIGRQISFFPHIIHYTSEQNKNLRLTKEDYDYLILQYKEFIQIYVRDCIEMGIQKNLYSGVFYSVLRRYYANNRYGDTNCVNSYCTKCDISGKKFSCLYIRNESVEKSIQRISKEFLKCKSCTVYDMCGAACIKSLEHDLECYFYYTLYSWFKDFIKPYEEVFKQKYEQYFYISKCSI